MDKSIDCVQLTFLFTKYYIGNCPKVYAAYASIIFRTGFLQFYYIKDYSYVY